MSKLTREEREAKRKIKEMEDAARAEAFGEYFRKLQDKKMSLFEYQMMLFRRLNDTLYKLDLSDAPRMKDLPPIPYDKHLTKTPWYKRLLGNPSTYVEYDDSGSKTIS